MKQVVSKQAKLLQSLKNGTEYTAAQITSVFGLKNPREAIRSLRASGHCIYSNPTKLKDGREVVKYRLGVPSKRMVQIANAVMGATVFTAAR